MSKSVTVKDIRSAIENLPDFALVLINDHEHNECELAFCSGAHDGRYGQVLKLKVGGYAEAWNIPLAVEDTPPDAEIKSGRQSKMLKIMGILELDKEAE